MTDLNGANDVASPSASFLNAEEMQKAIYGLYKDGHISSDG